MRSSAYCVLTGKNLAWRDVLPSATEQKAARRTPVQIFNDNYLYDLWNIRNNIFRWYIKAFGKLERKIRKERSELLIELRQRQTVLKTEVAAKSLINEAGHPVMKSSIVAQGLRDSLKELNEELDDFEADTKSVLKDADTALRLEIINGVKDGDISLRHKNLLAEYLDVFRTRLSLIACREDSRSNDALSCIADKVTSERFNMIVKNAATLRAESLQRLRDGRARSYTPTEKDKKPVVQKYTCPICGFKSGFPGACSSTCRERSRQTTLQSGASHTIEGKPASLLYKK